MGSKSAKTRSCRKLEECFDLFTDRLSGEPFQFCVDIDDAERRQEIVSDIQDFGGVVLDSPEGQERRIKLVDPNSRKIYAKEDGDIFSFKFVEECVAQGGLPESLVPYRVNFKSIYEEYEPMDILLGKTKWSDLPKTFSARVRNDDNEDIELSDIEDENVLKEVNEIPQSPRKVAEPKELEPKENEKDKVSQTTTKSSGGLLRVSQNIRRTVQESSKQSENDRKVSAWLSRSSARMIDNPAPPSIASSFRSALNTTSGHRDPYTNKEEASIVKDIVDNRGYNGLKGNQFWKECEERGIACKGNRTWQSMKERFRKKISPNIHKYDLTDEELGYFRKWQEGIPVEFDTSDEDRCDSEAETEVPPDHSTPTSIENGLGQAEQSTPKSKKSTKASDHETVVTSPKSKRSTRSKTKTSTTNSTLKESDGETVTTELEVRAVNVPRTSPRLSASRNSSPDLLEQVPKKRHKLWNQKTKTSRPSSRLSMMSETPGRAEEVSKKAKKDYLEIINPTPSTSRDRVPPPVFKVPKSPAKKRIFSDDSRIDENSSDEEEENRSTISRLSTTSSANRRNYSFREEEKIVQWIARTRRYSEVNGIAMWKIMEASKVLEDRSYQSMKERFRKHIIRKIEVYNLTESEKAAFKSLNAKKKFRPVKKNGRP